MHFCEIRDCDLALEEWEICPTEPSGRASGDFGRYVLDQLLGGKYLGHIPRLVKLVHAPMHIHNMMQIYIDLIRFVWNSNGESHMHQ